MHSTFLPDPRNLDPFAALVRSIVAETIAQLAPHLAGAGDARLSLADAATLACVKPRVLSDAARRGEITIEKAGRASVLRRIEIERWLTSRAVKPALAPNSDARAEARASNAAAAARIGGAR